MKLLLVVAPSWSIISPPLGVACVAGALRTAGHAVEIVDLNARLWRASAGRSEHALWEMQHGWKWEAAENFEQHVRALVAPELDRAIEVLAARIAAEGFEAVGYSVFNTSIQATRRAGRMLRARLPGLRQLIGGPAAVPQYFGPDVAEGTFDAVVIGEGEQTVTELVAAWSAGRTPDTVPGLLLRAPDGSPRATVPRALMRLDDLPLPEFGDFDLASYQVRALPIMMSRGCIARCAFCEEVRYWQRFRLRSPGHILAELQRGVQTWGVDTFYVADSLINGNHRRLEELCDRIIASGLRIYWGGYARVDPKLTPARLDKLRRAGCTYLTFGMESASQRVLDLMRKDTRVEDAHRVVRDAHAAGIEVSLNLLLGFPGEEEADVDATLRFIEQHRGEIFNVNVGHGLGIDDDTPLNDDPAAFGIRTGADGRVRYDGWNRWETADGRNTPEVRAARVRRTKDFLDAIGVRRNPAD